MTVRLNRDATVIAVGQRKDRSHVEDILDVEVAGGTDLEDVDETLAKLRVDDVAIDGLDPVLPELFGIVGEVPDTRPEQFLLDSCLPTLGRT